MRGILQTLFLLALLAGLVGWSDADNVVRQRLQFAVFDTYNRLYPRPAPEGAPVVIVDIDEQSLKELGQWPWPRTVLARLVDQLAAMGAKAVAFDMVFAEPDRTTPVRIAQALPTGSDYDAVRQSLTQLPDHDAIFGAAIARNGRVITGFTHAAEKDTLAPPVLRQPFLVRDADRKNFLLQAQNLHGAANTLPVLTAGAAGNGSFIASPAGDGILREVTLVFSGEPAFGPQIYPALSIEALRVALGGAGGFSRIEPATQQRFYDPDYLLRIGSQTGKDFMARVQIPLDADGHLWVYYRPLMRENYIPAHQVIDAAMSDAIALKIKDKIVLVGASPEGLKDVRSTPLDLFVPGVEVHFNVIEQTLQGKFLLRPYFIKGMEALVIGAMGLAIIALTPFLGALGMMLIATGFIVASFAGSFYAFHTWGLLLDPLYPALCVGIIFSFSALFSFMRAEAQRRQVRQAFGLYISPDYMKELTRNPGKLQLGGETRELSIMFTDIRNFTTIAEGMNPAALITLMNDFLTPMSEQVMRQRGTIDKYIGDAMMAFWNAPLDDPDHARHACRAALGMQSVLEPINQRLALETPLRVGIGLNTGPCAVGNMGSRQRFAYSALGDAVNLASRLEGLTKTYGVPVLAGEAIVSRAPEFAFLEVDLIRVKGKSQAVRVYALLGDEACAQTPEFKELTQNHDKFLNLYRAQKWEEALAALTPNAKLDALHEVYRKRISAFKDTPPPADWDGVFKAQTK
ncbi:MAG: adenylate/guanylate cyclase domain-containing protein [Alphaproteobacteria bacterium]|nr:adenylate/guanylate cyclase domain-containing protein [Alphaproteobacteria bacterium]